MSLSLYIIQTNNYHRYVTFLLSLLQLHTFTFMLHASCCVLSKDLKYKLIDRINNC